MLYRRLGQSDLEVSVITMGCWAIAGDRFWGPQDEGDAIGALRMAVECGINLIDIAEAYGDGRSEELVGKAFKDMREKVIIATKVSVDHLRPEDVRAACEASLKRLGTDYIDVYYIHWPNWDIPVSETLGAMEGLKEEGKIRIIGCSNFGRRDLTKLLQYGRVEVIQLPYSLLWRAVEYEILPTCVENGVSVACYSPLLHGLLTGKFRSINDVPPGRARTRHFSSSREGTRHGEPGAEKETFEAIEKIREICQEAGLPMTQVAIAWLLRQDGIATVTAGARNPKQIRANASAASLELPRDVVEALTSVTEPLKEKLGSNADLWQSDSRIR